MTSAHRRNNSLDRVKINGEWLLKEQEVREGIVNTFQQLLSEDTGWKADIGRLQLDQINQQEAENMEIPFTEIEVHTALMEMNGDKAPGPNGFTVAFWQSCWDFAKEEILDMFKEFREHNSFLKSLNNTFLVLIPKKMLANMLKKVVGKVVSTTQNAFVMGRQILDAFLIANEVIDSWQKRKEKGLICKLDIEKAYDSINWKFLLKVLQKMGFGAKWLGWMWSCLSSAKFSILVNGVPTGFFPSTKGLRQGDPLSDLFVMEMEVLDVLIRRAVEGDSYQATSDLRINLAKSEIIPVGEVEEIEEMTVELGCRVGSLPSQYLRLPLGAPNRAPSIWDGVEERVRRRLALWKRKNKGGLGLRKIAMLNKALLGKWIWRYGCEKDNLWKQVITTKYGQEDLGWRPKKANGAVGIGVWKESLKESDWCLDNLVILAGKGTKIRFWTDIWCTDTPLSHCFPHLFVMAINRDATVEEMWDQNSGVIGFLWRKIQFFEGEEEMVSSGSRKLIVCWPILMT
ncbi:LINE-1 reverse transcriptase-like [Vitis vinifera]|uniref:LINE-1 reverse transcriptase-like n=1 Tax=Vitis vinifera TaxID=29760 RepID=A0A438HIK1_VITVI|nr:LINE-1 reverse transcriptase-like [Vitis vinifera]